MADQALLEILKKGPEAWNQWRRQNLMTPLDLSGADLSGLDLSGANLFKADLTGANLSSAGLFQANLATAKLFRAELREAFLIRADLRAADFSEADLSGADLTGANVLGAKFLGADLTGADLHLANLLGAKFLGADLTGVDLRRANLFLAELSGANLNESIMSATSLGGVDLSGVEGLETVRHEGPSTVGIDIIYRSEGKIPEVFLRGAGVPDQFITYMKSLVVKPIEYYSCFISYSSKDEDFVKRLYADLQREHVRCWFAPEDLKIGDKFRPRIEEAIRLYDKVLLVLSENSVNSVWVETEVEAAFEKERQHERPVLFPVRLDNAVMETRAAWAADIHRKLHIGDFRHWKDHDSYTKAFARLLRDLKAEDRAEL